MLEKIGVVIALTVVALVIGVFGIVVFIGVGETLNNSAACAIILMAVDVAVGVTTKSSIQAPWLLA